MGLYCFPLNISEWPGAFFDRTLRHNCGQQPGCPAGNSRLQTEQQNVADEFFYYESGAGR